MAAAPTEDAEARKRARHDKQFAAAVQTTVPQLLAVAGLIFGGCCSNVFTLEAIVQSNPQAGNLITFVQFVVVAAEGYVHHFDRRRPPTFLEPAHVPFMRWVGIVALFFAVSVLNNYVWQFHISVPVHIIFRSGGTVVTMAVGHLAGRRYSARQVASVVLLTAGVVTATLGSSSGGGGGGGGTQREFALGIALLLLAQVLSAVMSLATELTYRQYGNHWRENLFYTHFLSLPFFAPAWPSIARELRALGASGPLVVAGTTLPVARDYVLLALNGLTQYVCVRGVNKLAGSATAVTVTIVLNVRKCVSLLLSVYVFGNTLSAGTCAGAALVFAGAGWYSLESAALRRKAKAA
ncbi:UAA transporter [Dipodascopsis tothii]|uniref:UAA transporter n=1 Tax=Dipodascopsis tothii TaxID=44089 RepID=UPI0034CF0308